MSTPDERMPTDAPLLEVLAELEEDGYDAQFVPRELGVIRCAKNNHEFSLASAEIDSSRRLEGVSDPADMMMVVGLHCPVCDAPGSLVLHYGPEASAEESDALAALPRDLPDEHQSGSSANEHRNAS